MFSLHNGAGIFAQRNGEATIRVYAAIQTQPKDTDRVDGTLTNITITQLLARFKGWSPALLALISDAECIAAIRPIYAMPAGLGWKHKRGLTLLGDAAHLMPPLGVGVNLAMLDAADLAEALLACQDWEKALHDHEASMLERAEPIAIECNREFAKWFTTEYGRAILDNMDEHKGREI